MLPLQGAAWIAFMHNARLSLVAIRRHHIRRCFHRYHSDAQATCMPAHALAICARYPLLAHTLLAAQ